MSRDAPICNSLDKCREACFMSRSEVGGEPVRTTCELVPTSGNFDRS